MQALDDINVVSLAQIYNGPYCALMLSYLGADVVKLEPPGGETHRSGDEDEESPDVLMLNSSKRGVTLDLKSERGKELFGDVIEETDVLIENFRVGTMDRLGLGYETLSEINPELIYAHGSGYGEQGPYTDYPAMDFTVQAMSGVMDVTGFPDNPPVKAGIQLSDILGGIHLTAGVLGALYQRERTGEGQFVEVGMLDTVYPTLTAAMVSHYETPETPPRTGNRQNSLDTCPYNAYETADGYLVIFCVTERHWERLVDVIDDDELRRPEYETETKRAKRMDEVDGRIEAWTSERKRDELADDLLDAGVPCAPVRERDEVLYDPHLEERGMINEIDHPNFGEIRVPGMPIRLHGSEDPDIEPAPMPGQDNAEVYRGLGLSTEEIERLEKDGVI